MTKVPARLSSPVRLQGKARRNFTSIISDGRPRGNRPDIPNPTSIDALIERSAAAFGVSAREILSPSRLALICQARSACALVLYGEGCSFPKIARAIGRKDHTTAMHMVASAESWRKEDPGFAAALAYIKLTRVS